MNTSTQTNETLPDMWVQPAFEEAPCPIQVEEVKARFSWRTLLIAPWPTVVTLLWGVAAADEKYIEEVPVVLAQVEQARLSSLSVNR